MKKQFRDEIWKFQPGELFSWYMHVAVPLQDLIGWPPGLK